MGLVSHLAHAVYCDDETARVRFVTSAVMEEYSCERGQPLDKLTRFCQENETSKLDKINH